MSVALYTDLDYVKTLDNVDYTNVVFYSWETRQEFANSTHQYKIAVVEPDYANLRNFENICNFLAFCDMVVVYSMELFGELYDSIRKFDRPNFVFTINGVVNEPFEHAKVFSNVAWFRSTAHYYVYDLKHICLEKLIPFAKKPYKFDALYGIPKKHREFSKEFLSQYDDQPWFYQSPFFGKELVPEHTGYNRANSDFWEDEIVPCEGKYFRCTYYDVEMNLSQVIPFKVYDKTSFSLVCETEYRNEFSFFTEKIVKPILARRLFVVISGQYYLRNLRSFGFKTFDTIIDESYDAIEDQEQRWTMALEQAAWLCQQDFATVMNKITPIVLHNYDVLKNLDDNHLRREVECFLLTHGCYKK